MHNIQSQVLLSALSGESPHQYWDYVGFGLYALMVVVVFGVLMFLATWLGDRRPGTDKDRPYESGVIPSGSSMYRFPVQFYLVAIFFIIFDLESAFIFAWAVSFDQLGWPGYIYITFFILLLMAGLAYVWKKKGLEWGPKDR